MANLTNEQKAQIIASYTVTGNQKQTAQELGIPASTVGDCIRNNYSKPEYAGLIADVERKFAQRAEQIALLAMDRAEELLADRSEKIPASHLNALIGTMIDKKLLLDGKPTARTEVIAPETVDKLAELAGYERRVDEQ